MKNSVPSSFAASAAFVVSFLFLFGAVLPRAAAQSGPAGEAWSAGDVGATMVAGSVQGNHPQYTVTGSGADIWGAADAFQFYHVKLEGDGTFIARVNSLSNTHDWAKAGLMVREDLSPGARNVFVYVTPRNHVGLQSRSAPGAATTLANDVQGTMPQWLKLVRTGNTFGTFRSVNGVDWVALGTTSGDFPASVRLGLAVTSHNNGLAASAVFDQTAFTAPAQADTPPPAPTALHSTGVTATSISLGWSGDADHVDGYAIERAAGTGGSFAELGTTPRYASSFTDTGLTPNSQYTYRVRSRSGALYSGYSNTYLVSTVTGEPTGDWTGADIGYVGPAGTQTISNATITVNAGGNDMWDTADGFRFVYRTLHGDGEIMAHVTRLDATNPWTKAGVMIRESLDPGARNVLTFTTPPGGPGGVGMQARTTTGGTTQSSTGGYHGEVPTWVRLVRRGDQITSTFGTYEGQFGNGGNYGGTVTLPMGVDVLIGVAVSSHNPAAATTAVFEQVQLGGGGPPPVWTQTNWNGAIGSFLEPDPGHSIDLQSDGADIWGSGDDGVFVWQRRRGDVDFTVRLDYLTNTNPWAKGGIMFRASDSPDAANVFLCLTPGNGVSFQYRGGTGQVTREVRRLPAVPGGRTLRLHRVGNNFAAGCSDGAGGWIELGSASLVVPDEMQMGFAVSSHEPGTTASASFTSIAIR